MRLEHDIDRLEIEIGRHVADRAVFVVERLGRIRAFVGAFHQVFIQPVMAHHVAAQVHRHEAGELDKAGIDAPAHARIIDRHGGDHVVLEPHIRLGGGVVVDRSRAFAGVDRAAHHGQRQRAAGVFGGGHDRGGGERRDRGLAHRHHVRPLSMLILADVLEKADQVIDVVIEIESARGQRHVFRIGPVGDVNHAAFQHALDRAAQQRRVVPAHRRDDQQPRRVGRQAIVAEALEIAEGPRDYGRFMDHVVVSIDLDRAQAKRRLAARRCGMCEHFKRRRHHLVRLELGEGILRIGQHVRAERGHCAARAKHRTLNFIHLVEHLHSPRCIPAGRPGESSACNVDPFGFGCNAA